MPLTRVRAAAAAERRTRLHHTLSRPRRLSFKSLLMLPPSTLGRFLLSRMTMVMASNRHVPCLN